MLAIRKAMIMMLFTLILFAGIEGIIASSQAIQRVDVVISNDGVVHVSLIVDVEPGLNEYKLPVEPIVASIVAKIDGNSTPVFYSNGTLYLPSEKQGKAVIDYLAKVTLGKRSTWFTIVTNETIRLDIAPNIILLGAPQNLINSTIVDGHLVVTLFGPLTINYTLTEVTVTGGGVGTTVANTGGGESTIAFPTEYLSAIIIFIIAILLIIILKKKSIIGAKVTSRREGGTKSPEETEILLRRELDSTDKKIIQYLREKGGEAYQSEIRYALKIPKATLSRRIAKLARLGIIEVVREGKLNKIILKHDPGNL